MTRSLQTITAITKTVIDAEPWTIDPRCLPIPWREEAFQEVQSRKLVFGLLIDDGVVKVHPPIRRALLEVAEKLRAAGHEVVEWDPAGHQESINIMVILLPSSPNLTYLTPFPRISTIPLMEAKISAATLQPPTSRTSHTSKDW